MHERLRAYSREEVERAFTRARVEGAFLIGAERAACFVALGQSEHAPRFTSRIELTWPSAVPGALLRRKVVDVFVQRDGAYTYVGEARLSSYAVDGSYARFALAAPLPRGIWRAAWDASFVGGEAGAPPREEPTPPPPPEGAAPVTVDTSDDRR